MEDIKNLYLSIPTFIRNKYFVALCVFLVWMFFFDTNTFTAQFNRKQQLSEMKAQKAYYLEEKETVTEELERMTNDNATLERFAREKYYMKKKNEDVFVIERK